jgi:hypothetical protein
MDGVASARLEVGMSSVASKGPSSSASTSISSGSGRARSVATADDREGRNGVPLVRGGRRRRRRVPRPWLRRDLPVQSRRSVGRQTARVGEEVEAGAGSGELGTNVSHPHRERRHIVNGLRPVGSSSRTTSLWPGCDATKARSNGRSSSGHGGGSVANRAALEIASAIQGPVSSTCTCCVCAWSRKTARLPCVP